VIVGVQAIPACFDAEQHRAGIPPEALDVHFQVYDTLLRHPVRTDSAGHRSVDFDVMQPGLLQSWDTSADGRTWSLQLRRSVISAAGNELTAHDVKWSWERAFALNSWSARIARACGVSSPDCVRVAQTYTVQFRLEAPHERFPAVLAAPFPAIHDLEFVRHECPVGDPWGDSWLRGHAAGFGPYTLDEVVGGEEAHLRANLHYVGGAAREKRVLLRAIPVARDRAEALLRGGVDIAADLPAAELACLKGQPAVSASHFPGSREIVLRTDPAFPPFDQPRVLDALAAAVPYEAVARDVFAGAVRPLRAEQDQRRARSLLREAGYGSGFRFSLSLPDDHPDLAAVAQAIQIDAIRLNLKVVVERLNPSLFARQKVARQLPAYLEERQLLTPLTSPAELEPLPRVKAIPVAQPHCWLAARANVDGFARRPDGRPRYFELRKL